MRRVLLWRRVILWGVFASLYALLLTQMPLFGVLGFEFALAMSPVAALGAGHLALGMAGRARKEAEALFEAGSPPNRLALFARPWFQGLLASSLALLVFPFGIILTATLLGSRCDLLAGLSFFLMGPVLSLLWGASWGYAAGALTSRRSLAALLFALWCLFRFGFNVAWFLSQPPIFAYNPLVGYFPGSLYDEQIEVEAPYLWFRLGNLLEGAGVLLLVSSWLDLRRFVAARRVSGTRGVRFFGAVLLLWALLLGLWGSFFGFRFSAAAIQEELGGFIETAHFRIYYPKNSQTAKEIERVARDHEYRYAQILALFGEAPPGPIESYIYGSYEEKHRLFGTRVTQFAKPWLNQIHLNASGYPHPVLKHELAHVMAGVFADWPFRTAGRYSILVNVGLIEGLATAVEWSARDLDPHQWSAAMRRLGLAPPIEQLFSPTGFFGQTAGLSYTLSGSFVRFLLDTYGIEKLKVAYRTGDLEAAYQKPLDVLTGEWGQFIDALPLRPSDLAVARARFDRPSIFSKICAHEQAVRTAAAQEALSRNEVDQGVALLRQLCTLEPHNPRHLLPIASAYTNAGRFAEAKEVILEALSHPRIYPALAAEFLHLLADISFREGDYEDARRRYAYIYSLHLSEGTDRLLEAKISALDDPRSRRGMAFYFFGQKGEGEVFLSLRELWDQYPTYALAPYLLGRQLFYGGAHAHAIPYLEAALRLGLPGEALQREAIRVLGIARALSGHTYQAALAFRALSAGDHPPEITWEALDWLERLGWEVGGGLAASLQKSTTALEFLW